MGAVVVEQVVAQFILDDKGYKKGADAVVKESQKVAKAVDNAQGKSKPGGGGILKGLGEGLGAVTGAFGAVAATIGAVAIPLVMGGKAAVQTAIEFDTLQRSLTAITGSGERTAQILGFIDKLAIPSVFDTATLGESAKLLEAFGLNTERFLPIAEKLGTVFGGNAESLNSFVAALGYLKSGRFGEAFESLARGGVSRELLTQKGLEFDKGGSFKGTVEQALTAVELVVNEKFGKLSEEMASGPMAKLASLGDAFNRVMRQIGLALVGPVVTVFETLSGAMENLTKVNVFGDAVKSFIGSIQSIGGVSMDAEESLLNLSGSVVALGVFFKKLSEGFTLFKDNFMALLKSIPIVGQVITLLGGLSGAIGLDYNLAEAYGGGEAERFIGGKRFDLEQRRKRMAEAAAGEGLAKAGEKPAAEPAVSPGESVKDLLKNISDSSATTASNTEKLANINDRVLGGGGLASRGLSRQEMTDLQTRRGSGTREIKGLLVELGYAIERNVNQTSARNIGYNVSRREI
jgi:hypothetical protein